jgi:protocatechuate 3,4-dioxygenase beta subunit
MGIKLKLALAGAALVATGAFVLRDRGAPGGAGTRLSAANAERATLVQDAPLERGADELMLGAAAAGAEREPVTAPAAAAAPPPVRVRVVDPDGAGVAGARVRLSPYAKPEPMLAGATTDAQGRAALAPDGPALQRARLDWRAPGLRGGNRDYDDLSAEIELRLSWAATLVGTVRDAATQQPLAGAALESSGAAATSGADGAYRLEEALIGYETGLAVRRAGYAPRELKILVPGRGEHRVDVELEPASVLRVRVVERETGAAIDGAEIAEHELGPVLATCDADGYAELDVQIGAELTIVARAPGRAPLFWNCELRASPDPVDGAHATLPLRAQAYAEGVVLDPDGRPLANASVWSACEQHGSLVPFSAERRDELGLYGYSGDRPARRDGTTDAKGAFRIPLSPCDDPVRVTAAAEGLPAVSVGPLDAPPPGGTLHVDLRLRAGGGARGRVTRNGEPWSGGEVVALGANGAGLGRAHPDAEGRFALDRLAPGPVQLELRKPLSRTVLATAEVVVTPGAVVEQDLGFAQTIAWIRGRVVAPDGSPRPDVEVSARAEDPSVALRYDSTRTAPDGTFSIEAEPGALYSVDASFGQAASASRQRVAAGTEGLELVLARAGTLRLRVVDAATGEPPGPLEPGAWGGTYALAWAPSGELPYRRASAKLDLYGRTAFGVEAGSVDVLVHLAGGGYAPARVRGIAVPEGAESDEVLVRLERGADARLDLGPDVSDLREHLLFLLEERQLASIEGPFPVESGRANDRINGIRMRLEDPLLLNQFVDVEDGGVRVLRGLAPGRYHLRIYPDDIALEPASFDLPAAGDAPIRVRRRAR